MAFLRDHVSANFASFTFNEKWGYLFLLDETTTEEFYSSKKREEKSKVSCQCQCPMSVFMTMHIRVR